MDRANIERRSIGLVGMSEDGCAYAVDSGTGAFLETPALELLVEAEDAAGRAITTASSE